MFGRLSSNQVQEVSGDTFCVGTIVSVDVIECVVCVGLLRNILITVIESSFDFQSLFMHLIQP